MIFLVDYENVSSNGLVGAENLTEKDKLIIFYSKNSNKISFESHMCLEKSKSKKEYIEIKTTSQNALDFQLATYLGFLINEFPNKKFAIVSKDKGYNAVVEFWKNHKKEIHQYSSIEKKEIITEVSDIEKEVKKLLKKHPDKVIPTVNIINKYKTKQEINVALVKEYKSELAGVIYKSIKPLLKDKVLKK